MRPLGKSDFSCIEVELKMKSDIYNEKREHRNWSKIAEDLVFKKEIILIEITVLIPLVFMKYGKN